MSPMPGGNGAYVLHKLLEKHIAGYQVREYHPRWEYFPFAFPLFFRKESPCLIHTTPDHGCLFSRRGIPLVVTVHHLVLDDFMKPYSSLIQRIHYKTDLLFFTRRTIQQADAVTAVSRYTAGMVKNLIGYKGNVRVIYNGIDTQRFVPVKRETGSTIRVLFSGNLSLRKGANLLPDIAERLPAGIDIVYTRGLRGGMSLPASNNLKSLGNIAFESMPGIYQSADILLFPTVREGFGLAAAEAMACGLPVVATDCSSLPELIDEAKGGFLCPLGDVDSFVEKIQLLAENPGLRREMGAYNRAKVEQQFTLEQMVSQYQALFEELLSGEHAP